jgi:hypothetical protein
LYLNQPTTNCPAAIDRIDLQKLTPDARVVTGVPGARRPVRYHCSIHGPKHRAIVVAQMVCGLCRIGDGQGGHKAVGDVA